MNIEKTYLEDEHQLKVTAEIEQDAFDKAKYLASKKLSKGLKISGFRPGKAPYKMIVQHMGEEHIINEAIKSLLDNVYPEIINEIDEELYNPGQLQEIQSFEPLIFEILIPLKPTVELGEYHSIRIPYNPPAVSQEDIDEVIKRQRSQQSTVKEVDHPAEENNIVDTKVTGRVADADPEDEEAHVMTNQPLPVLVKSANEDNSKEWPFPGFSRQLLGASRGDTLELIHEHSETEAVSEDLPGKEVLYTVSIESIRERVLPEFNDEFVQSNSNFETVEEFVDALEEGMGAQAQAKYESAYVGKILDAVLEVSTVKYPSQMLEDKVEAKIEDIKARLKAQELEMETYLEMQKMSADDLQEQVTLELEKSLPKSLLLGNIFDSEDLNVTSEDVTTEYQRIVDEAFGSEESSDRKAFYNSQGSVNLLNSISSRMTTDIVLNFLQALAKGEDVSGFKKSTEEETEVVEERQDTGGEANAEGAVDAAWEADAAGEIPPSATAPATPQDGEEA